MKLLSRKAIYLGIAVSACFSKGNAYAQYYQSDVQTQPCRQLLLVEERYPGHSQEVLNQWLLGFLAGKAAGNRRGEPLEVGRAASASSDERRWAAIVTFCRANPDQTLLEAADRLSPAD